MTAISTGERPSLTVTRTLNASREAVFRAWTDPKQFQSWMRPDPAMQVPEVEIDLRIGGKYRFVMQAPDGERYIGFGT
ncbi:MAG TPA: SRPBCC domain-containing protein, partial [Capsulimonadaceae bacterium]|nr:SRPBCC domain-containing protein [Capsulimonadaceae bacterium]